MTSALGAILCQSIAKALLQEGKLAEVVRLLQPDVARHQDDSVAWSLLGAAYFELEQWEAAEEAARHTLRLTPNSPRQWSNLGTILRKQGRHDEAEDAQHRALELDRKYRRAETELAKIRKERKTPSEDDGWRVRTPDGDFIGPLSKTELTELLTLHQVESGWSARRGAGRIVTVREAIGDEAFDEAVRARAASASTEPEMDRQPESQKELPSTAGPIKAKLLVSALVAVIVVLGASLVWLLVTGTRHESAMIAERPATEVAVARSPEPEKPVNSPPSDSLTQSASREPTQAPIAEEPEPSSRVTTSYPQSARQEHPEAERPHQSTDDPAKAVPPGRQAVASSSSVRTEALDAIGDLETAVEVGVNYRDYSNYLIEAKRELRRLQSRVPAGALWWTEIELAMYDYEFAGDAWDWKFSGSGVRNFVYEGSPEFQLAYRKYGQWGLEPWLSRSEADPGIPSAGIPPTPSRWMLWVDGIVQTAWSSASSHLARASVTTR